MGKVDQVELVWQNKKKKKDEVSMRISAGKRVLNRQNLPRTANVLTHMLLVKVQLSHSSIKKVLR